ncbi:SCO2400 family protein [Streptomyces griseoviridis]|uniref:SCO2400 family protein n=1 Tax=Streptomyces griseoviridis TaxID=45398 RepID=UPI0013E3CEEE|nr:hypothetical protein [Streptomyces griseoviridis]
MDYCDPCRRHLNGALTCPGCGATVRELPVAARPDAADGAAREEPEADAVADGATSRRDRKATAHRRRRRRVLWTGVGFVLAAGGLSLAELGVDAPFSGPPPAGAGSRHPDGAGSPDAVPPDPSAPPADGAPAATSASPAPDASSSPSASASPSPTGADDDARGAAATTAPATGPAATTAAPDPEPASQDPSSPPAQDPTTPEPDPTPSPTPTCDRFLWWCD